MRHHLIAAIPDNPRRIFPLDQIAGIVNLIGVTPASSSSSSSFHHIINYTTVYDSTWEKVAHTSAGSFDGIAERET